MPLRHSGRRLPVRLASALGLILVVALGGGCASVGPKTLDDVAVDSLPSPVTAYALGSVEVQGRAPAESGGDDDFGSPRTRKPKKKTSGGVGFLTGSDSRKRAFADLIQAVIARAGLFQAEAKREMRLTATPIRLKQPGADFGPFRSQLTIHYHLETDEGQQVFDGELRSTGEDDSGSPLGAARAGRAAEVTLAENLYELRAALEEALIVYTQREDPALLAGHPSLSQPIIRSARSARSPYPRLPSYTRTTSIGSGAEPEISGEALVHLPLEQGHGIGPGEYYALVIGNDDYDLLPDLQTAVNDARAVSQVLERDYAFRTTTLIDATRGDILRELTLLRSDLTERDSLLIYYAGHGSLDRGTRRGYWLPVDAAPADPSNWISAADVTDILRAMPAHHVMVVADSCYSGALTRGLALQTRDDRYVARLSKRRARVVLTSGGLEPVDDGTGDHSVFARAFLSALDENEGILEGAALFTAIRRPVLSAADQNPEYGEIRFTGHEGGDFLFVRDR